MRARRDSNKAENTPENVLDDLTALATDAEPAFTTRLTADIRASVTVMSPKDIRFLVGKYVWLQKDRLRMEGHARTKTEGTDAKPPDTSIVERWLQRNFKGMEAALKVLFQSYAEQSQAGRWMLAQVGIGPVIAAGMLAYIDPERQRTVGQLWRFAGLDPTTVWKKGELRPWCATLKCLSWKAGRSFELYQNKDGCYYGEVYAKRKAWETARNARKEYAELAAQTLSAKKFREDTETRACYEQGMLPPGRIQLRAIRYAAKLFMSHAHHVVWCDRKGCPPPVPFVCTLAGHDRDEQFLPPPGWPCD